MQDIKTCERFTAAPITKQLQKSTAAAVQVWAAHCRVRWTLGSTAGEGAHSAVSIGLSLKPCPSFQVWESPGPANPLVCHDWKLHFLKLETVPQDCA